MERTTDVLWRAYNKGTDHSGTEWNCIKNQALIRSLNIPAAQSFMDNTENQTGNFSFLPSQHFKLRHCISKREKERENERMSFFLLLKKFLTVKTRHWHGCSKRHITPMPEHTMKKEKAVQTEMLHWPTSWTKVLYRGDGISAELRMM